MDDGLSGPLAFFSRETRLFFTLLSPALVVFSCRPYKKAAAVVMGCLQAGDFPRKEGAFGGWGRVGVLAGQEVFVDERKLQVMYVLVEEETNWQNTSEDIGLLHQRRDYHLKESSKSYPVDESL